MRSRKPTISKTEWIIMTQLWKKPSQTITELKRTVQMPHAKSKPIYTLLYRLHEKGFVQVTGFGMKKTYSPTISKAKALKQKKEDFCKNYYGNDPFSLIIDFLAATQPTEEQKKNLTLLLA